MLRVELGLNIKFPFLEILHLRTDEQRNGYLVKLWLQKHWKLQSSVVYGHPISEMQILDAKYSSCPKYPKFLFEQNLYHIEDGLPV